MIYYDNVLDYIKCADDLDDKIAKINAVIDALMDSMLEGALKANVQEYSLDDGQTKIKEVFTDVSAIYKAIEALEKYKNKLINRCMGRVVRLRDKSTFFVNK